MICGGKIKKKSIDLQSDANAGGAAFEVVPSRTAATAQSPSSSQRALFWDTTSNSLYGWNGTAWAAVSAGGFSLEAVRAIGNQATGAISAATGLAAGAVSYISMFHNATDGHIVTDAGDIHLEPAGGDVAVTGNLSVSGTFSIAALTTSGLLTCDAGILGDGWSIADGTGAFTATGTGAVTLAGAGGANKLVVTAGDAVLSDGSLSITDADNAASLVLTNNTFVDAAAGLVDINAGGAVTGNIISVVADALTTGTMLYLETSAGGMAGKYIQCYDGGADDFSVGLYGATIIAGNAAGTAALTVSAGDLKLSAGVIDQDIVTDHSNVFTRNQGTTTGDFFQIVTSAASDDHCALSVSCGSTGAVDAVEITYAGSESGLKITPSAAAGSSINALCAANATDSIVKLDGATNDWIGADDVGLLNISCDGALAHAHSSCLRIDYSGAGAASGLGTCIRVEDTGSTASSYAVCVRAATGEALKVDAGKSVFDEGVLVGDGGVGYVSSNGAQDLVLRTNEGTNSGSITITDGAAGNITIDCDTTGRVSIPGSAVPDSTTRFFMPFLIAKTFSHGDEDANFDIKVCDANTPKMKVIDAWVDMTTDDGEAKTLELRDTANSGGNEIMAAVSINTAGIVRAATLTTTELAANSSIFANFSAALKNGHGVLYISGIEYA